MKTFFLLVLAALIAKGDSLNHRTTECASASSVSYANPESVAYSALVGGVAF